jgi:hypothetical protein
MNKTLYIRDEDAPLWDRARELSNDKLSPVIVAALKQFVADKEAKAKGFDRIQVSFNDWDAHGIPKKKAFHGRWIFPPDKPVRQWDDEGTNYYFAIAITAKGAAVVYCWEQRDESLAGHRFLVYRSLEEAAANNVLNYAVTKAIEEIGVPVEELDI